MEVSGSIYFHFHGVRTLPELSSKAYGCQDPLGSCEPYWSCPASTLSVQEPSFSSRLGTQSSPELCCGHVYLFLAFWTDRCGIPVFSPTSHPCLVDGPWNQLITLSEAVDGTHCYDHLALAHVQSLWDWVLLVRAPAVPGHLWLLPHHRSWHSRVHAAP